MQDRDDGPLTYTVEEGFRMLRVGRNAGYDEIKRTGTLAGVKVLRVGRQLRLPGVAFRNAVNGEAA